ncbi:serine protease [Pedobacter frigiditerrae]|uniref:Serine protease n=1 Tax=Pedobacter frigiditerrae TaxID=2530452 RepID=A0A4R0MSV0_9SPHI|nr:serine protease [Pedobacter frigiditerrae]TCC90099.1 serine protease [Pedobacter frigiditerrae]
MRNIRGLLLPFLIILIISMGCSKKHPLPTPDSPSDNIVGASLMKIEDALKSSDLNFVNLVNKIRGSVGTNGSGSKVIWSKNNDYKLGLFVSANHVYGVKMWNSHHEEFIDLSAINNGIFLGSKLPAINGNIQLTGELVANFGLYHPSIPLEATNITILPRDDFYLGVIDNQRKLDNGLAIYPDKVQTVVPLQLYDPNKRTEALQVWTNPETDENVIAIGYPQDRTKYPNGAVSTGKVYSDTQAANIIQSLKSKNDVEGEIPYQPQVEFFAEVAAVAGMSGGGVFNRNGQLLGIMVRATQLNGQPILRVVRIKYIKQKLISFYTSLSITDQAKLRPFISGELK